LGYVSDSEPYVHLAPFAFVQRSLQPRLAHLPRITVVTPSFNQAAFLERTIRSVLNQGYPNLEYIVMDGGSTDGSVEIIRRYADRLAHWTSGPDEGQAAAIRAGWVRATGDVLAWLNSDDFYQDGALRFVGERFADDPRLELLYGRCELVDPSNSKLGYVGEPFSRVIMLASHDVVPQPAAFMRATAVALAGGLDTSLHYAMDFDLFMRLAERQPPRFVPRLLAGATIHPATKTLTGAAAMAAERHAIRRRHARGLERLLVEIQPLASRLFRATPEPVRRAIRHLRPRRVFGHRA
jgi:glycosyltransferase involved in cell wall biosynthesis